MLSIITGCDRVPSGRDRWPASETLFGVHSATDSCREFESMGILSLKNRLVVCFAFAVLLRFGIDPIWPPFAPQLRAAATPPEPVTLASGWQLQDVAKVPQPARKFRRRLSTPAAGTRPRFPAQCSPHWSTITFIPSRSTAKTTAPKSFPRASSTLRTGIGPSFAFRSRTGAATSGSTSTASTTPPKSGSTARRWAQSAAHSSAASSTSPRRSSPASRRSSPCWSRRSRIPAIPHEHTLRDGVGPNGGVTAIDGPTFLSHHRLGLDSRHPRPRHRHLAKGISLRHRPRRVERSAGHHRSAAAEDRLVRRCRADHG